MSTFAQTPSSRPTSRFFSERPSHAETNRIQAEPLPQPRIHTLGRPVSPPSLNGNKAYSTARSEQFSQWTQDRRQVFRAPGSTREQNVQAAQANAAEDVVSITSASSKTSQASRICRQCKQPTGISNINPLYKCTTCHRHWHKHCGVRTYSAAEKASRDFVCDKCPTISLGRFAQGSSAKRKAEEPPSYGPGKRPKLQGPERSALQQTTQPVSRQIVRGAPSLPRLPKAFRADEQTEARLRELFRDDPNFGVPKKYAAPVHNDPELRRCLRDVYELAAATNRLKSLWDEEPRYLARTCKVQGFLSSKLLREIKKILERRSARAATSPAIPNPSLSSPKMAASSMPDTGPQPSSQPLVAAKTSEALVANVTASLPKLIDGAAGIQGELHSQEAKPANALPSTSAEDAVEHRASVQPAPGPSNLTTAYGTSDVGVPPQKPSLTHQLPPRPPMPAVWKQKTPSPSVPAEPGHTNDQPLSPVKPEAGRTQPTSAQPVDPNRSDGGHRRVAAVDPETRPPSVESQSSTALGLPVPPSSKLAAHAVQAEKTERHLLALTTPLFVDDPSSGTVVMDGWRELTKWAGVMGIPHELTYAKYVALILGSQSDSKLSARAFVEQAKTDLAKWATTVDAGNAKPPTDHQPPPTGEPDPQHGSTPNQGLEAVETAPALTTTTEKGTTEKATSQEATTESDKPGPPNKSLRTDEADVIAGPTLSTTPLPHLSPSSGNGNATSAEEPPTATIAQHDGPAFMVNATPALERKEVLRRERSPSPIHGVDTPYSPAPSSAGDTRADSEPPSPVLAARRPQADSGVTTSVPASQPKASLALPTADTKPVPVKWKARRTNSDVRNRDMDALIRVNYSPASASVRGKTGLGQSLANLDILPAATPKPRVKQALSNGPGSPSPSATTTVRPASLQLTEKQSLVGQLEMPSDAGNGERTEVGGTANIRANVPALPTAAASRCFIPKPPRRPSVFQTPQQPARGHLAKSATKQHDSRSRGPSSSAYGNERQPNGHRASPQTPMPSPITPISQGRESPAPTSPPVQANFSVVVPSVQAKGTRRVKSKSPLPALKTYVDQACQTSGEALPVQEAAQQSSPASTNEVEETTHEEPGGRRKIDAGTFAQMKAQGMMVEDSDADDSHSDDEPPPQRAMITLLQTKQTSKSLFDVAPSLRPLPSPDPSTQYKSPGPRKAYRKNMTAHTLEKRRQQFGNDHPHRVVERDPVERMVTTTRLRDFRTLPRLRFDDPPERVRVEVPFSEYMEFPKDLVYVPQTGANAHKQLVFRDGTKEKKWLESGAPRRTRKGVEQEWVYKL